jgi:hypothetical protein
VGADGSVSPAFGPGATEDTVISVADNGFDPATLRSPSTGTTTYSYLGSHASAITTAGGAAKYVLAWVAAGRPAAIDGSALLAKLNMPAAAGGYREPNGAFHNASAAIETANVFSQALAVLADLATATTLPPHATAWLACAQRGDGGFGYAINDTATTPPVACGDTSSDTNSTAIVLQALGRAGITSADSNAKTYLHSVQHSADGGFGFNAGSGSDPDSDGTVIQALVAIGENPTAATWTVSAGGNPLTNLESFADPKGTGGYINAGSTSPDAFTTSTVPQALALKPYGAATTVRPGAAPPAAAVATATPAPTSAVQAVSVPDTGGAADIAGSAPWAYLLGAAGSLVLACGAFRRRSSSAP